MEFIPVAGPWITQKEIEYVADAAAHGWYENADAYPRRFERAFAEYLGVRFAVCLPSCTSAIHLSLLALGVGPGDEVVVPEITWIASAAPVSYVGATPVFADVDRRTWCLSPESFERSITPRTRAVIPVDLYGGVADLPAIREVAARRGIAIVEDAAQAIGSELLGRKAGAFGDIGVFSFHGSKTVTTGEGGMLVTDREDLYRRVLVLRDHGRRPDEPRMFWNEEVAHKYKMSALQAALGVAQLERIEELLARKREIFEWYRAELGPEPGLELNFEGPGVKNTYWMVTVVPGEGRRLPKEDVIAAMRTRGIACRPYFYPLSSLPAYRHLGVAESAPLRHPVSYDIAPWGVNLPSGFHMDPLKVKRVCDALREILPR